MSLIGKEITDFKVHAYFNDDFIEVSKNDLLGHWSLLFFYPADFTFVCPTELQDLAASYDKFKETECEIYAVSSDTHFVHKSWHDSSEMVAKVNYPMLADPTHQLMIDLDVYNEKEGVADRGAFILDPKGVVQAYEVVMGDIGRNAAELFRKVQALQYVSAHGDQACPAKWSPGAEVLTPGYALVGQL